MPQFDFGGDECAHIYLKLLVKFDQKEFFDNRAADIEKMFKTMLDISVHLDSQIQSSRQKCWGLNICYETEKGVMRR